MPARDGTDRQTLGSTSTTYPEQLVDVEPDVHVGECGIQNFEIYVIDVLENQGRSLGYWIPDDVQELDDVGATTQYLQNFDLSLDLLLLDRFEDLDDTGRVGCHIDTFEHLTVLATTDLSNNFVVVLIAER